MVWIGVFGAFLVSAVIAWAAMRVGPRFGVVDLPDEDLKTHSGRPVPLGGAAVLAGCAVGMAMAGEFDPGLFMASGLIFFVGLVDDIRGLSPSARLAGSAIAGMALAAFSSVISGPVAWVVSVVAVVVLVNAVNLLDGLDGLASTVCSLAAIGLAVLGSLLGADHPLLPLALASALIGVLVFNWPPARLYLGDNGAYVVGVVLAWSGLRLSSGVGTGLVALALVGVPLLDLAVTVTRRARAGARLFTGDRDHTYDRLNRRLKSVAAVVSIAGLVQLVWSAAILGALQAWGVAAAIAVAALVGVGAVVAAWISG